MSIEVDSSDDSSCPREFLDALSWFEGQGLREAEAVSALGSAPVQELIRKDKTGVQCKVLIWLDHNFHTEVLRMTRRLSIRMLPARQLLYHYCASHGLIHRTTVFCRRSAITFTRLLRFCPTLVLPLYIIMIFPSTHSESLLHAVVALEVLLSS